ncbi:expressed unknown protein [Seminavis robusta]|uniref:Uncharacterized protein n=1 Tax=Seminavis robusta TaxID=568900 RepID=A0A9N8F2L6_9STRA|nr:expressed unknown protein [Seminavis robusta]|eukprot:Sro3657_g350030.1 n/a (600) ;mRNA; r:124-1923
MSAVERCSIASSITTCASTRCSTTSTSTSTSTSVITAHDLVVSLEELLLQLEHIQRQVPGFEEAAGQFDFCGRWDRLHKHTSRLSECTSMSRDDEDTLLLATDFEQIKELVCDCRSFLETLEDAKIAPRHRWQKWWDKQQSGKYQRPLEALSNRLNEVIVTHVHHVWDMVPLQVEHDTDSTSTATLSHFPFTMDQMGLTAPVQSEHEELTGWHGKGCDKLSFSQRLSTSMRSTASTASTVSMDSSMRSYSTHNNSNNNNNNNGSSSNWTDSASNNNQDLLWDFSPRPLPPSGWGSNGGAPKTRRDLQEQYVQTQRLRELSQDIPVQQIRVVLAQLEAGDTSPTIVTAKTAMMTLGYFGALMVSPLAMTFGLTPQEAIHETPLEAAAVFSHYLLEFELADKDGTIATLENCVNDIYLYEGRSTRAQQHVVTTIPMLPGAIGAPNSVTRPLLLRDLIRFRNQQRQQPYRLFENNCKHFCVHALTGGDLFPKATNVDRTNLEVFYQLCQGCYVQEECFDLFTDPRMPLLPEEDEAEQEPPPMDDSSSKRRRRRMSGVDVRGLSERDLMMDDSSRRRQQLMMDDSSRRRRPVSIVQMSIDFEW